jgi:quercetin dioxygenase-like cupin family protein
LKTIDLRPAADMTMRIVRSARDTNGELLEVDVFYGRHAPASPMHIHPEQEEMFIVHSGTLDVFHHGRWHALAAGQSAVVPPGMVDAFRNRGGADVLFSFTLRPALDFDDLLQELARVVQSGEFRSGKSLRGMIHLATAQLRYPRSTFYTNPLLRFLIRCASSLGRLLGYRLA